MDNSKLVADLINYFSTGGSLSDLVAFTQMVAARDWGAIAQLAHVVLGTV